MKYQEYSDEGTKGISVTRDNERSFFVHVSMQYLQGSQNIKTEAVSYIYTQALLAGCGNYTRKEFLDAINLLGASVTVEAQNGILTMSFSCLDTHRSKLMKLVEIMVKKPTFKPTETKRIIELVTNELIESKEDAKSQSLDSFVNCLYTKNDYRYSFSIDELITEIKKVTKSELQQFHTKTASTLWTYTFASDTKNLKNTVDFLKQLHTYYKKTNITSKPKIVAKKEILKNTVSLISIPSKQNIEINIGNSVPLTQDDDEYYAFVFGLNVLGKWGGFAGRLMSTVREKEGLTYGIYAKTETTSRIHTGYWRIMTFFAPEKVIQGITATLREIELIKTKGITQTEFERFKVILQTQETLLKDSLQRTVGNIHALQTKGFTLEDIHERTLKMTSVSRVAVNNTLKKHLDTSKLVISCAGPISTKARELNSL